MKRIRSCPNPGSSAQRHVEAGAEPPGAGQVTPATGAEQAHTIGASAEDTRLAARDAFMDHVMRCYQCSHVGVNCVEADGLEARMNTARKADHAEPAGQS